MSIIEIIQSVGFPIFVAAYLLIRTEQALNRLQQSLRLLTIVVAHQQGLSLEEVQRRFGNGRTSHEP